MEVWYGGIFDLFKSEKKSDKVELLSVISGELQDISKVPDPVFSGEIMGPGFTIEPNDNKIFSPVDGVIKQVAEDKHAVTLEADNGAQILIHIGVDTVNLKGKGFINNLKVEQKVKVGDLLIIFDMHYIEENAPSKKIVVILLNHEKYCLNLDLASFNQKITAKETLNISIQKGLTDKKKIDSPVVTKEDSHQRSVFINHKTGIHARPAALIQNKAKEHEGDVTPLPLKTKVPVPNLYWTF